MLNLESLPWLQSDYFCSIFKTELEQIISKSKIIENDIESSNALKEQVQNLLDYIHSEYSAMLSLSVSSKLSQFSSHLSQLSPNDPNLNISLQTCLNNLTFYYYQQSDQLQEITKQDSEFLYSLGVIAYYYTPENAQDAGFCSLGRFIFGVFGESLEFESVKLFGLKLIERSNNESAFWFLQGERNQWNGLNQE